MCQHFMLQYIFLQDLSITFMCCNTLEATMDRIETLKKINWGQGNYQLLADLLPLIMAG